MASFDGCPEVFHALAGKGRIFFAGQGINVGFAMRREMLSPEYTTDWNALPRAFMR